MFQCVSVLSSLLRPLCQAWVIFKLLTKLELCACPGPHIVLNIGIEMVETKFLSSNEAVSNYSLTSWSLWWKLTQGMEGRDIKQDISLLP